MNKKSFVEKKLKFELSASAFIPKMAKKNSF